MIGLRYDCPDGAVRCDAWVVLGTCHGGTHDDAAARYATGPSRLARLLGRLAR